MSWTHDDWSALGSALSGVGTVLGAATVLIAAIIGSRTFNSWRRQKLSERRIEQAERILTAAYKARRALGYVRSPLILAHELVMAEEHLKNQDEWLTVPEGRKKKLITAQAYHSRLNAVLDERRAIDECLPMARALFGEDVETALDTLNRQFHFVSVAVESSSWNGNEREFERAIREDLSSSSGTNKPNKMNEVIAAQVKLIEDRCVPVLRLAGGKRNGG